MIGRLKGTLLEKKPPYLLVEVQGVGYEVQTSMQTFYRLPEINESLALYTHFSVREDAQQLYGFFDERERVLFRTLIKVNGVGPKLALTILSSIDPDAFVQCVIDQDNARLTAVPGVGKKTADRLIIEMRDKLTDWDSGTASDFKVFNVQSSMPRKKLQDAISALVTLGYRPQEASKALNQLDPEINTVEEMIRAALKRMNQ
jgi:holliday junction DNA helicase RuvA